MSYLNHFVQKCHDNIINKSHSEIEIAKDYLSKRHINSESICLNKIGYCCHHDDIPREICFYGKTEQDIMVNGRGYEYFIKGKIIVPIYSEFGKLVGLATRTPSFEPGNSWWNLSKPFHKSEHLFLLNKSRKNIFDNNKIYLVEGYIDAIMLYQEGIKGVACLMGTKLSPRHVGLIARYCSNICLCLDVDKNQAGQKAQEKSIYIIKKFDFCDSISVIDGLPVGEDPDVFISKNGAQDFLKMERKMTESEINRIYRKISLSNKRG